MGVPGTWREHQGYFSLVNGETTSQELKSKGWTHALVEGGNTRTAEDAVQAWRKHVEEVEGTDDNSLIRAKQSWKEYNQKQKEDEGAAISRGVLPIVLTKVLILISE